MDSSERGAAPEAFAVVGRGVRVRLLVLGGCLAAVGFAAYEAREAYQAHRAFVVDDAYITLRYARHLAEGLGPVWNPGERVEGYTSFLAVVLIAGLHAIGMDLTQAALRVNVAGLALLVLAVLAHGLRLHRGLARWPLALGPAVLVATYPPLYVWIHGRLEAPLYAGLIGVALYATCGFLEAPESRQRQVGSALALGLLTLVRPDGGLFGLLGAVCGFVACMTRPSARFRDYLRFALVALALPVAHLAFRRFYYGEWVPNTVFAKGTGIPEELLHQTGYEYVKKFLEDRPYFGPIGLASLPFALLVRGRRLIVLFLAGSGFGYLAMIGAVGGDHMAAHRLLIPAVPALALLFAEGLRGLAAIRTTPRGAAQSAAVACAAAFAIGFVPGEVYRMARRPDPAAYIGTVVGEWLDQTYPPGTLVALHTAGSTPYFAPRLRFIDMLGLNDAHIARRRIEHIVIPQQRWPGHAKGDGAYVLAREPDVIILGPAEGTDPRRPWFLSDVELGRDPAFRQRYAPRTQIIDVSRRPHFRQVPSTHSGRLRVLVFERRRAAPDAAISPPGSDRRPDE